MHSLGELWLKIKQKACKLLFEEKLDSWKQAICYVALKEHYSLDDLEYILNLDRSTIYRNSKKAEENLEQTKDIDIEVEFTILLQPIRGDAKNTSAGPGEILSAETATSDVDDINSAETTTPRFRISTKADSTSGPSREISEVENTIDYEEDQEQ